MEVELSLSKTRTAAAMGRDTMSSASTMLGRVMSGSSTLPYFTAAADGPRRQEVARVILHRRMHIFVSRAIGSRQGSVEDLVFVHGSPKIAVDESLVRGRWFF